VVHQNDTIEAERPKVVSFNESPQIIEYEINDSEEMGATTESTELVTDDQSNENNTISPTSTSNSRDLKTLIGSEDDESIDGTDSDYDPLDRETNIEMVDEVNDGLKLINDGNNFFQKVTN